MPTRTPSRKPAKTASPMNRPLTGLTLSYRFDDPRFGSFESVDGEALADLHGSPAERGHVGPVVFAGNAATNGRPGEGALVDDRRGDAAVRREGDGDVAGARRAVGLLAGLNIDRVERCGRGAAIE